MADTCNSAPLGASNTYAPATPGADSNQDTRAGTFDRALAAYIAARTAHEACADDDATVDQITYDEMRAAESFLMDCYSPDVRALLVKFEIIHRDEMPPLNYIELLRRDMMKLAGASISPIFIPEGWLSYFRYCGGQARIVGGQLSLSYTGDRAAEIVAGLTAEERNAVTAYLTGTVPQTPTWAEALTAYRNSAEREEALRSVFNNTERLHGMFDPAAKACGDAWTIALSQRAEAWRALAGAQVSSIAELRHKIAVIRADDMLDADAGEGVPVIDAIAADLAKMEG